MSLAMVVALKVISRNVARSQVTFQKIILTDRTSLLPQVLGRMNIASTLPQTEADFFDEQGLLKEYRPPVQQQQYQQMGGMFVLRKIPITSSVSESASDPVPDPIPTPDFPFQEFPLTEVVTRSQIDSSSISDMLDLRENQQFFEKSHQEYRFTLEIRLEQQITRRNEGKQRSHHIR